MKFSRKDQRTLLYVVGVLLIIAVYFLYFSNQQTKLKETESEISKLKDEVDVLKNYEKNTKKYKRLVNEYYAKIDDMTMQFPKDVKEENIFMFGRQLETSIGVGVTGITIGEETLMNTFGVGERQKTLYGKQSQIVFGGEYVQVKQVIDMIMQNALKRNIVALTLTRDEETGILVGNVTMNLYRLHGKGQGYEKPNTGVSIPGARPDIFN